MSIPQAGRRLRLAFTAYGLAFFVWLPVEDQAVWPAVLFGAGLAFLMINSGLLDKIGGQFVLAAYLPAAAFLWGALNGAGANLLTTAVMFLKNALHAHIFPDYPPALMLAMLQRAPAWAAAGGLFGLGLALLWLSRQRAP